ncbi:Flagellar biosynthesis protein FliQ [Myxococcus hansupus]|uniref:Flagellar biosynthetic protein FliQ n=3 Tax=Myxococcaceae TaxID=31 RepID=Q1D9K5_MYXXD|nr:MULTISPECIES: flagellar biosynthesis protein FliQ [Bacteria]GHG97837.1 flagellar biosynthetic protein FliQ [Comamonas sp. KCTC 72670]ABF86537.1 FliQ/MopD/SpaQ family protein [Myxococcus xanthus DK 1622]AKQ67680.1 Flagellar biosynthesis protein FliQ [Myxococcus hansupus]MBL0693287.1 flagellar biosynthesis protein FliQ [Comamonas sp. JC664]NOJ53833.1 flagellar biosynthesis protein FliQ [Myxococcus xanthus]
MNQLTFITQEALFLVLVASAPPVLMSLLVGFIISLFQATTQIQEQTLTFAPKVVAVFGVLALAGPWIGSQLVRFTFHVFDRFPALIK